MKRLRTTAIASITLAALAFAGCSSGTPEKKESEEAAAEPTSVVVEDFELPDSPTITAAQKRGTIRIGVKEDQPGLGYMDAATGERTGFDVEIARWLAASMGFGEDDIEFVSIPSANREQAIVNGDIDFYAGTYSITDKRKEQIGFAGPYFITGQGLLVLKENEAIQSEADLAGVTVCSATGSTPIQNIKDNFPDTKTVEFDTYSQCVEALRDGQVDAVTTDQAILIGYAAQEPDALKVVGEPFTEERYGIGVPKADDALRHHINTLFTEGADRWTEIYNATLGKSGTVVEQPAADDY